MGATFRTTQNRITARMGMHARNTRASRAFIQKEKPTPKISITGPRASGRSPPFTAFWRTVTSVVIRVTREEVSNRSRFTKANFWTRSYWASRIRAPQP